MSTWNPASFGYPFVDNVDDVLAVIPNRIVEEIIVVDDKVDAHGIDTTAIHGIADTAQLATITSAGAQATAAYNTAHAEVLAEASARSTADAGKAALVHTHAQSEVTNLVGDLVTINNSITTLGTTVSGKASTASVTAIYPTLLGSTPQGTFTTVQARLDDVDSRIGTGGPPPSGSPSPSFASSGVGVTAGYTQIYLEEFTTNAWLNTNGGPWTSDTGNQSGTQSYNLAANLYPDTTQEMASLRSQAIASTGYPFSSAQMSMTSSTNWWPFEFEAEIITQFPMTHCNWACWWINAANQATNGFEIDVLEQFTAQTPGKAGFQLHWPSATGVTAGYGGNLVGSGKKFGAPAILSSPPTSGSATVYGGSQGATYASGGRTIDIGPPSPTAGPASGQTDWFRVKIQVFREYDPAGSGGWRPHFKFFLNGVPWAEVIDLVVGHPTTGAWLSGGVPAWYTNAISNLGASESHFWAPRFDNWIGGSLVGRGHNGSSYVFVYDGIDALGATVGNVGLVPNATIWSTTPAHYYNLNLSAVRACRQTVPTPDPGPPAPPSGGSLIFDAALTGTNGTTLVGGVTNNLTGLDLAGAGGTQKYDTSQSVPTGTNNAIKFDSTGTTTTSSDVYYDPPTGTFPVAFMGGWFKASDATPASNQFIFGEGPHPPTTPTTTFQLYLRTDGKLWIRDSFSSTTTGGAGKASTTVLADNTWYWIETKVSSDSQTMGYKIWSSAGSLLEDYSTGGTYTATTTIERFKWGGYLGIIGTQWWAGMVISNTDWVGFNP